MLKIGQDVVQGDGLGACGESSTPEMAGPTTKADSAKRPVNTVTAIAGAKGVRKRPYNRHHRHRQCQANDVEERVARGAGDQGRAGEDPDVVHDMGGDAQDDADGCPDSIAGDAPRTSMLGRGFVHPTIDSASVVSVHAHARVPCPSGPVVRSLAAELLAGSKAARRS